MSGWRKRRRDLDDWLDELEGAIGDADPAIVFAERDGDGERYYHGGDGAPVDAAVVREAAVVLSLEASFTHVISPETLEVTHAHPIDPVTGGTVEAVVLNPETFELVGIDGEPEEVAREYPALFKPADDDSK